MDSELLEWLSFEELEKLEGENLVNDLTKKLMETEKFNIEQITNNQSKAEELIRQIDKADLELKKVQEFVQETLDRLVDLRHRAGPLENESVQYMIEQRNLMALMNALSGMMKK
jgi:hypothetical protein